MSHYTKDELITKGQLEALSSGEFLMKLNAAQAHNIVNKGLDNSLKSQCIKESGGLEKYLNNAKALNNAEVSDFGYKIDIDTLTEITSQIIAQKFYTVNPADHIPVQVGFGAWSERILTYNTYYTGDDFQTGLIDISRKSRLAEADMAVDSSEVKVKGWAMATQYNLIDLNKAQKAGSWSLVEEQEKARKKLYDLGIQKTAFLGLSNDNDTEGLYNLTSPTVDNTLLTASLSSLNETAFETFLEEFIQRFYTNSNSTALPDRMLIPTSDYLGLTRSTSETFPLKSKLQRLNEALQQATNNPNAKVTSAAYGSIANNNLGVNRYVLYNNSPDVLKMHIPVGYTVTGIGTYNNFQFQSVAYSQFTGVQLFRPLEVYYFGY